MKKYLLLALLIPNLVFALPQTLNSYMVKHSTWSTSDKASLSYITPKPQNPCKLKIKHRKDAFILLFFRKNK